jgi:hypothetical protein
MSFFRKDPEDESYRAKHEWGILGGQETKCRRKWCCSQRPYDRSRLRKRYFLLTVRGLPLSTFARPSGAGLSYTAFGGHSLRPAARLRKILLWGCYGGSGVGGCVTANDPM